MTVMKWRISGQRYKHLTRFSRFLLFESAAASVFVTEGLFYVHLFPVI